jgi:hypothetical protein
MVYPHINFGPVDFSCYDLAMPRRTPPYESAVAIVIFRYLWRVLRGLPSHRRTSARYLLQPEISRFRRVHSDQSKMIAEHDSGSGGQRSLRQPGTRAFAGPNLSNRFKQFPKTR